MKNTESFSPEIFLDEEQEKHIWKMQLENEVARTVEAVKEISKLKATKYMLVANANWDLRQTELVRDDQKIAHAAKACADVAKNIVAIASTDRELLEKQDVHLAISALKTIAKSFLSPDDGVPPFNGSVAPFLQAAEDGLIMVFQSTTYIPTYTDGYLIDKRQFIHSKFSDIQIGIAIMQSQNHLGI